MTQKLHQERWLTIRAVSDRTGLGERTIRRAIAEGKLAAIRPLGLRTVRVPERALSRLAKD
jgi:excisionase family DNA binding protein